MTLSMNLWTVLPVKSLQETKSRLGRVLSLDERGQLTQRLLVRTLALLQTTPYICETAVISRDANVQAIATQFGCRSAAEEAGSGLNGAAAAGVALAAANGATHCLVLPSDLPFLRESELLELVYLAQTAVHHPTLILCSDRQQQGTNAMILPVNLAFRFQYGRNSFQLHQQEASRLNLICQIAQFPGLQFDLDTEQDYDFYTKQQSYAAT